MISPRSWTDLNRELLRATVFLFLPPETPAVPYFLFPPVETGLGNRPGNFLHVTALICLRVVFPASFITPSTAACPGVVLFACVNDLEIVLWGETFKLSIPPGERGHAKCARGRNKMMPRGEDREYVVVPAIVGEQQSSEKIMYEFLLCMYGCDQTKHKAIPLVSRNLV